MIAPAVLVLPKVKAPGTDRAFLAPAQWQTTATIHLVRAEDGDVAGLPTEVRLAWSERGLHLHFRCTDPLPLSRDFARDAPIDEEEVVGVFLDPIGERNEYMAILASPYGRVADARIENPHHHAIGASVDDSWDCTGVRVRSWAYKHEWVVEMLIPFTGITPALVPPRPGDRWTGNFYRIERQPIAEVSAWQPTFQSPVDLHTSESFGILEFGESLSASDLEL